MESIHASVRCPLDIELPRMSQGSRHLRHVKRPTITPLVPMHPRCFATDRLIVTYRMQRPSLDRTGRTVRYRSGPHFSSQRGAQASVEKPTQRVDGILRMASAVQFMHT